LELQYQNSVDEKMDTNKTTTPSQDVQSIVEQQLVSIESKLAETLESLKVQEMKTITAEAQLADVTKNLGLSKVDVRILSRENNELQEQNTRLMETKTALSKENEKHCEAVKKLTIKINGLQSQLETAQTNVEIKDSEVIGISQIMRILKDKLAAAQDQQYDLSCGE
jgi:chromosome segregation ATPase